MGLERIGKYRIVERIGGGAMGEVYRAHDPLLNRHVAVKTISASLGADESFRRRFRREAQSAGQLNHPNIITVYDFGEDQGITYMAMELLEGVDLREVIGSRLMTRLDDQLALMQQICDGVGFAHSKGVVHRDLKPGNIHLQPSGQVKILDFGLARLGESDMTRTGTVLGTPNYMSPEQVRGEKADARSDVFSLGTVLYELISGHKCFDADSVHGVLFQILEGEPPPVRKWAPDVPPAVATILDRALAKEPERRFAHAGEMAVAIGRVREVLAGETLAGPPPEHDSDLEATLGPASEATTILDHLPPAPTPGRTIVTGATALDLGRLPAARREPGTARPARTVHAGPDTQVEARRRGQRALRIGAGALVLVVAGVAVWMRLRPAAAPAAPTGGTTTEQVGILTEALLTSQLELARVDLDNKDYAQAAQRAEQALKLDPQSADARDLLDRARVAQKELDASASEARSAFQQGDMGRASTALARVLSLDPRHAVAGELSAPLNQYFRGQAEAARKDATHARAAAERARATTVQAFAEARSLAQEAEGLVGKKQFAVAAQKYMAARDAWARAQRDAETARAAAAAAATPRRPEPTTTPGIAASQVPSPARPAGPPTAPPVASAPTAAPTLPAPAPVPTHPTATLATAPPPSLGSPAPATAPAASVAGGRSQDAAVRALIADYGRAIESQDVALFKSLKPDLSAEEEKRLRESFAAIKSQKVGITIEAVEIEGTRAAVHVVRQDTVNGHALKLPPQVFYLIRDGADWRIQSIGKQ